MASRLNAGFCLLLLQIILLVLTRDSEGLDGGWLSSNSDQYEKTGSFEVGLFQSQSSCSGVAIAGIPSDPSYSLPPTLLLIAFPSNSSGEYPVVLLKHGMFLDVCSYSQLMCHIASYGYIVVAPQESRWNQVISPSDCSGEIDRTARVLNWFPSNLAILLESQAASASTVAVTPRLGKLFLAGHSRGGKVVYALALGLTGVEITLISNFSGLIALDPVDGSPPMGMIQPPITTRSDCKLDFPTLIEGTGLGGSCAPSPYNHQNFYNCTVAPIVYHLVPSEYGHMDFLDDGTVIDLMARMCGTGGNRAPMRNFTGGLIVSFLESVLDDTTQPMDDILANWQTASIKLDEPQCSSNGTSIACPTSSLVAA